MHRFNLEDGRAVTTMAPLHVFSPKCTVDERIANLMSQNIGLKHIMLDIADELRYALESGYLKDDLSANLRINALLDIVERQFENEDVSLANN